MEKASHQIAGLVLASRCRRNGKEEEEKTFYPFLFLGPVCAPLPSSESPGPLCAAGTGLGTAQFPRRRRRFRAGSAAGESERTQSLPEISLPSLHRAVKLLGQSFKLKFSQQLVRFPFSCSSHSSCCFHRRQCPPRGTLLTVSSPPSRLPPALVHGSEGSPVPTVTTQPFSTQIHRVCTSLRMRDRRR